MEQIQDFTKVSHLVIKPEVYQKKMMYIFAVRIENQGWISISSRKGGCKNRPYLKQTDNR